MKRLIALLFAIILVAPPSWGAVTADPRKPLLYGICNKPFPAFFALDYPFCRASAWLAALDMAAGHFPPGIDLRLKQQGFATRLGRLAVAALICPLDVVTPENVPSPVVRVFLTWPDEPVKQFEALLSDHGTLPVEMAVIWETSRILEELRRIWPASVPEAGAKLQELETLVRQLRSLWQITAYLVESGRQLPPGEGSAIIGLLAAGNPQEHGQAGLETAVTQLLAREAFDQANAQLWRRLSSQGLYLRGLYHERNEQLALAEADYNAALARLQKSGADNELIASIYLARGNVRKSRQNPAGMCADYATACALGRCQELALARREGLCKAEGQ